MFVVNRGSDYCTSAACRISFIAKWFNIDVGRVIDGAQKKKKKKQGEEAKMPL